MPSENRRAGTRAERRTLLAALLLFAWLIGFTHACGSEDLVFPGEFAPTGTAAPTETDTPG